MTARPGETAIALAWVQWQAIAMRVIRRFWPLVLLLVAIAAAWLSGLPHYIGWDALTAHHAAVVAWARSHPVLAPGAYILAYAAAVALSVPGGAVITVTGGLLFGTLLGGGLAVIGSTLGAVVLFLAARHHLADALAARGGAFLDGVRTRLQRDGFSYLLAVRLVPAFPFWLVNLAAALCGMRLGPYVAATLLGVIPATMVYASIGAGLGGVLAEHRKPDLALIYSSQVLLPLIALAALSLLPLIWRSLRRSDA